MAPDLLAADAALAVDSVAYQAGEAMGTLLMLAVGLVLVLWGLQDRRTDGKGDGLIKICIGGGLLVLLAATFAASVVSAPT